MSIEITNKIRSTSFIRVTEGPLSANTLSANVALTDLAASEDETILSASIKGVLWSSNSSIVVFRGDELVLSLFGTGEMKLDDFAYSISTNNDKNIEISSPDGRGTILLEVSKVASYSPTLEGM